MTEDRRVPTKTVFTNYAENTSAHGIKKLTDNNGVVLKAFWLLLLLGAAAMILFQVAQLINLYRGRPVNTKTTIENSRLKFPSVTICNLNPVLNSKAKSDIIYDPVEKISSFLKIPLTNFDYNITDDDEVANYTFDDVDFETDDPLDESLLDFQLQLQSMPDDILESMSQPFNKFVISCQFGGEDCDSSNFTRNFDDNYGFCYTFPNRVQKPEGILVYNSGPLYGLKLILNVDQKEYIPFITSSAGARIEVHEFGSEAHPLELGQSLSTGFETQIGVKPIIFKRLPDPYGNCENTGLYQNIVDCERACVEFHIGETCDCTRGGEDYTDRIPLRFCEVEDISCLQEVFQRKQRGEIVCSGCTITCRVYSYEERISMTRWPASHYDPAVRFKLKKWSAAENAELYTEAESRNNLLTVNVYYSALSLQTIEEEPGYKWEELLSDIGGQLGLWLGISVLSVCEVFELFYLLGRNYCKPKSKVHDTVQ